MVNLKKHEKENDRSLESNVSDLKALFIPDAMQEGIDYCYLGANRYSRVFVITAYPRETYIGWLDELFSIGEVDVSVLIDPMDGERVAKKLTDKSAQVQSEYLTYQKGGNIYYLPVLEEMIKDLEEERYLIQTGKDKMFYATIVIRLNARTHEELDYKTMQVQDVFARKAAQVRVLSFRQVEGLRNTLPVGSFTVQGYERNVTTGGIASMFPISSPDVTHPAGVYMGKNLFSGAPMFLDTFIGPPQLPNPHVFICGITGSGKSVTLKTIIGRSALLGRKIVVLDPEGEYRKVIKDMLGGTYITIRQGEPAGLNLMEIEVDISENGKEYVPIDEKAAEIRGLLGMITKNFMGRELTALEIVAIDQAAKEVYEECDITKDPDSLYEEGGRRGDQFILGRVKKKMPTLSDFHRKLKEKPNAKELSEILIPFLKGGSMGMFDCETGFEPDEQFIGFNLFDIKDEFTKLYASFVILSWIWQKFVQKNRKEQKIIACDETWMFVRYREGAEFLETLGRRGRKHNASLVIASQYLNEFLQNEAGQAVIKSCATAVLLRQHASSVNEAVRFFALASGVKDMLETFNPGECIISINNSITAVKVIPTDYEWRFVAT